MKQLNKMRDHNPNRPLKQTIARMKAAGSAKFSTVLKGENHKQYVTCLIFSQSLDYERAKTRLSSSLVVPIRTKSATSKSAPSKELTRSNV